MSRPFLEFVHPDDVERARDALSHLATGEDIIGFECRLVCGDGSVRRFEWNTRTLPHVGVLYGIARDVTVRSALAEEQAALRRVAVLVAQQPSPSEVFTAVTEAVGLLLDADLAVLHVFPGDGTATTIASWSGDGPMLPIGTRFPLDGDSLAARIFETGAPARMHSYDEAWEREATDLARSLRVRSAVGAPILVEGKLWGALMAATRGVEPWAENAETRIAAFTELVATAIANAESREALAELADEQAALRRVATLVAQGHRLRSLRGRRGGGRPPVTRRKRHDGSPRTGRQRYHGGLVEHDRGCLSYRQAMADRGHERRVDGAPDGSVRSDRRLLAATDPIGVAAREAGIKSAVGSPVVVKGHLWGVITATSTEGPLAAGHRGAPCFVHGARRDGDRERGKLGRDRRVAQKDRRRLGRCAPPDRPRSARRRPAAPGPHGDHAQAGAAGAGEGSRERAAAVQEAIGNAERRRRGARARARDPAFGPRAAACARRRALASRTPVPWRSRSRPTASRRRSRRPPTSSSPRRSPTSPSTPAPRRRGRRAGRDGTLRVEVRDDGVGGARPNGAASKVSGTGSPRSTGASRSRAPPRRDAGRGDHPIPGKRYRAIGANDRGDGRVACKSRGRGTRRGTATARRRG